MKKISLIITCFIAALILGVGIPLVQGKLTIPTMELEETGIFAQAAEVHGDQEQEIIRIYNGNQLIGVVSDETQLNRFLRKIYKERYEDDFPNSSCYLGKDVYITKELGYERYENIDDRIFDYLEKNNLFTLRATVVTFADDSDVYARIYVTDEEIYNDAMDTFLSFFVSDEAMKAFQNGEKTDALTTYGRRETGISIAQTITVSEGYASVDEIMRDSDEVLEYLCYGEYTEKEYYTVQAFDTVQGVGSRNYGLTAEQVMNINRDKISSIDQVLTVGEELCVTYFNSPITVQVTKEALRSEPIYPTTHYFEDNTMYQGESVVVQEGQTGSKNALYQETWTNGVLMKGTLISSVDVVQPQDEIIYVGTAYQPDVGTGTFAWPANNPSISCRWMCYENHQAIDVVDAYNRYGEVLASDNGVVSEKGYHYLSGNYVIINHNNGLYTYYAHMNVAAYVNVGDVVAKGQVIGQIGMTGNASGPHIHFYIGVNGPYNNADPCSGYLNCTGYDA